MTKQNENKEFTYLPQLDKTEKFYKWKLSNFVIAITPMLVSSFLKTLVGILFSVFFLVVTLVLTFEPNPEEHLMNYLKVRVKYMFKRKVDINQQIYSTPRLKQISNLVNFKSIEDNHISLNKGCAVMFEYEQLNPELMSKYEIEVATKQKASFLSNFGDFKEMIVELSQSFDDPLNYNQELLKTAPPHLHEWIQKRIEYIERSSRDNKEDEKTSVIYLETTDDVTQFIRDVERLGTSNNVSLHVLEGNKLRRIMASIIADVKFNNLYPLDIVEALEMED